MRFKECHDGQRRTITKFLWFPKRIGGKTRWLELATILQWWYCGGCVDWRWENK